MKNPFVGFTQWNLLHTKHYNDGEEYYVDFVFFEIETKSTKVLTVHVNSSETRWVGD